MGDSPRPVSGSSDPAHSDAATGAALRALALYLPQFHPAPENDGFWEPGFTEWTNVTRAHPQFEGHEQPHLPAHLGFYDLRVPETRQAQADLARAHGIHGFVYYHYWFNGRRLLNRPVDDLLASPSPDFPFCLCWANENWTRRWDGLESEVLVGQTYSADDDLAHIRWLANPFADPRYIRVDGKPLFLVYRASRLPDPLATTTRWREEARRLGAGELYLCRVESFPSEKSDPGALGFDAGVEFQPDWEHLGEPQWVESHRVFDYATSAAHMLAKPAARHRRFPGVTPSWDNTARRRHGATIVHGSTPQLYEQWLGAVVSRFTPYSAEENFVFINAWNEWAEGNHLEPCQRWGLRYLESTARALLGQAWIGLPRHAATTRPTSSMAVATSPSAPAIGETLLTELYRLASEAAARGEMVSADALFRFVCGLAESAAPSLAGKACFKRAQLASGEDDRIRALLEQCLACYPEHAEARRQLEALAACAPR